MTQTTVVTTHGGAQTRLHSCSSRCGLRCTWALTRHCCRRCCRGLAMLAYMSCSALTPAICLLTWQHIAAGAQLRTVTPIFSSAPARLVAVQSATPPRQRHHAKPPYHSLHPLLCAVRARLSPSNCPNHPAAPPLKDPPSLQERVCFCATAVPLCCTGLLGCCCPLYAPVAASKPVAAPKPSAGGGPQLSPAPVGAGRAAS